MTKYPSFYSEISPFLEEQKLNFADISKLVFKPSFSFLINSTRGLLMQKKKKISTLLLGINYNKKYSFPPVSEKHAFIF